MRRFFGRHVTTMLVAMVTAAMTAGGPALAAAVRDGLNADQVDSRDAVGAGASIAARKGNLVATSAETGKLPNDIIAKAPDAQLLDGINSTGFERRLQRTVIVRRVGTPTQNGSSLRAALDNIPSSGDRAPSKQSPWLIFVEPGTFDLGDTALVMREWVDIHGAGMELTTLKCVCGGTVAPETSAAVYGANNATLQDLTVLTNTNGTAYQFATAFAANSVSARLSRVHLWAVGTADAHGLLQTGSGEPSRLIDSVINTVAPMTLSDVGVHADGGALEVYNSRVIGMTSISTANGGSVKFGNSQLYGASFGNATCAASYDQDFRALTSTCATTAP